MKVFWQLGVSLEEIRSFGCAVDGEPRRQ